MDFGKMLTLVGVILVIFAWVSATRIPSAADEDFSSFTSSAGNPSIRTVNFPDVFKQMSAQCRMLQNFYVGTAGLICLAVGLSRWRKKEVKRVTGANAD